MTEPKLFTTVDVMAWVKEIKEITGPRATYRERPEKVAGDKAEQAVHRMVRDHPNFKGAHIFDNKRVPLHGAEAAHGEIDVLVVTDQRIYVLEVKDWSGRLEVDGERWRYTPQSKESKPEKDWTVWNRTKAQALVEYLRGHQIAVPSSFVTSRLVLMNDKIDLAEEIAQNPDVIVKSQLEAYFAKQPGRYTFAERVATSLIRRLFDEEHEAVARGEASLGREDFESACKHIAALHPFDKVVLRGGRQLPGDIEAVSRGGKKPDWVSGEEWTVQWPSSLWRARQNLWRAVREGRRPLWGLLETSAGVFGIHQKDGIRFREVGQKSASWIPFIDVDKVIIG